MRTRLALFDLDNTLLRGDSDHAWGEYLINKGLVCAIEHGKRNDEFYRQYQERTLDIHEYVKFTLAPVIHLPQSELATMHQEFIQEFIKPLILPKAVELVNHHLVAGDYCLIITATNSFITTPIAQMFGVDKLIATDLVMRNDHFTGEILGTPCFQSGKVNKLEKWLNSKTAKSNELRLEESIFYSDSINDLPLLQQVKEAVVVDGDELLVDEANRRKWKCVSLR
jgi:HAD superfamily hydrolase (TIGR01490 family)